MRRTRHALILTFALACASTSCSVDIDPTSNDAVTYTTTTATATKATPDISTAADPGYVSPGTPRRLKEVAARAADSDCSLETPPDVGNDHVGQGGHMSLQHRPYSSDPPTSGPHFGLTARWGFYDRQVPDEYVVHNLEHGGVVIWYEGDPVDYALSFNDLLHEQAKLVVSPRANLDGVAATAWGVVLRCHGTAVDGLGITETMRLLRDFVEAAIDSPDLAEGDLPAKVMGTRKRPRRGHHQAALPRYAPPVIDTTIGS